MKYFWLYVEFYKIKLKGIAEYRSAFFVTSVSKFLNYFTRVVTLWIMISTFRSLGDWNAYEVMFLFGLSTAAYAIAGAFTYHISTHLSGMIKGGTFDEVLTKPLNPFLYLASRNFSWGYFGTMAIGLGVLGVCLFQLGAVLSPGRVVYLAVSILSGGVINGAMMILASVPTFWVVESDSVMNFMFNFQEIADYPISIFNNLLQILVSVVLPFAFITYFPALLILGKENASILPDFFPLLGPLVAAALAVLAYKLWMLGVSRYESTGS